MRVLTLLIFFCTNAFAHVPTLLWPVEGAPIAHHFLSRAEISRAVYTELTKANDLFVVSWWQNTAEPTLLQLFTPKCPNIPEYEKFQPSAILIRGEAPWKIQGESAEQYLTRLRAQALALLESNYPEGIRPVYEEKNAKQTLWIGAEWRGDLEAGLHTLLVYDKNGSAGNFVLGMNEKEDWNPDLYKYVGEILPKINQGLCRPTGFSGGIVRKP